MINGGLVPMTGTDCCVANSPVSIANGLYAKRKRLEDQLKEVNEAIKAVEANPEVVKVFDPMAKAGRY